MLTEKITVNLPPPGIRGINITAYPLSEALISCKFTLSYSDAKLLYERTIGDQPANREFVDEFLQDLFGKLKKVVEQKENRYGQ